MAWTDLARSTQLPFEHPSVCVVEWQRQHAQRASPKHKVVTPYLRLLVSERLVEGELTEREGHAATPTGEPRLHEGLGFRI